jgi:hypothetical protein
MARSDQLLNDFTEYCRQHPTERFWQALRNWSGHNFILASNVKDAIVHDELPIQDTFYWNSRDGR